MKKILLVLFLLICKDISAQTPAWAWVKSEGNITVDYSNATCTDANGNVFITGTFQGSSITFGNSTLYNTSTGSLDIFIVKYDANGNVLWATSAGGTKDDWAYGIVTDANGNVYITGFFKSSSLTLGTTILANTDSTGNTGDIFIGKLNSSGTIIWAKGAKNSNWDYSYSICTDANNNIYITGMFGYGNSSSIIFGSDTLKNKGGYDIFIAKYDSGGNVLWAKGAAGIQEDGGMSICTDGNNNVYVTGYFQKSAKFGNDTLIGYGNVDIFIAKYNTNGNKIWAKSIIGIGYDDNMSYAITADNGNNIYVTGYFVNSLCSGNDTLSNAGNRSIFISKYDSNGNSLWARSPGGTGGDWGRSISTDLNGNVFATGYFGSSFLNFGGIPVLNSNIGYNDVFVAEYDPSGNSLWATGIGGQDWDYGMDICTSVDGSVYVTGYYGSYSLNFGNTTVTNNGTFDTFLAKLDFPTGIENNRSSEWNIFPNPFSDRLNISANNNSFSEIILYDIASRKLVHQSFTTSINTEQLAKGIYFYEVRNKNGVIKKGKVVKE